jgi:hypothetical protein
MDAQQQVAWDCSISAVVLGKGEEFVLCPLDAPTPASEALARARGYEYAGVFGFRDGQESMSCEPGMERTMCAAAFAFAEFVHARLTPKGDGVDWLERLYRLPDTRE